MIDPAAVSGGSPRTLDWPPRQVRSWPRGFWYQAWPTHSRQASVQAAPQAGAASASADPAAPRGSQCSLGLRPEDLREALLSGGSMAGRARPRDLWREGAGHTFPDPTAHPSPSAHHMGQRPAGHVHRGQGRVHRVWLPTWRCCRQQARQQWKSQEGHWKGTTSSALQPGHTKPTARGLT